jgi:hypothetical protein
VLRWLWLLIGVSCACHEAARAENHDIVIANFSNAMLEGSEIQNGRGELGFRVASGYAANHRSSAGAVWRVSWLLGQEVCKFVVRDRMTIVTVDAPAMPAGWKLETIAGFQVVFSPALLRDDASSSRAREFLDDRLAEATRLVPAAAVPHLRKVRLWLDLDPAGDSRGLAFYAASPSNGAASPSDRHAERDRPYGGFRGAMYLGIVFPNIIGAITTSAIWRSPMMVLHELAHAYHHQVLGFFNAEVKQTYEAAKAKGLYRNVSYRHGQIAPVGYAMSNELEYFAELTEAYFGQNDQAPFDAEELKKYDSDGFRLIERAWNGELESIAPIRIVSCRSPT